MNTQTAERDAYSIRELADRYGVHRITIYREVWEGRLTAFRLRGRTYVSRDAVDAWRKNLDPVAGPGSVGGSVGGKGKRVKKASDFSVG